MPRETVFGEQHVTEGEGVLAKPLVPVIEVLWSRESGTVQIVTKATDAEGGRWMGDDYGETPHFTDGMHVDLDRAGINDLIRKARRARNQAFGADE